MGSKIVKGQLHEFCAGRAPREQSCVVLRTDEKLRRETNRDGQRSQRERCENLANAIIFKGRFSASG
jgi:hypothetical protein